MKDALQRRGGPARTACAGRRRSSRRWCRGAVAGAGGKAGRAGQVDETGETGEEAGDAGFQAGAGAQGDGPAQGDERTPCGGQGDVVHCHRRLRVSEQARAADRLHDALRRDDAAAGQAQDHHARRRAGVRVLLRRQGDDGLCAGRGPGRGRGCAADHRRRAEVGLRHGGALLSVHRRDRCRSLCRVDRRRDSRVLHRSLGRGRRREDGHGGVGEQRRVPADLDRRRRQAAAADSCRLCDDPLQLRHEMELSNWQLDADDRGGRLRVAEGASREAHRLPEPGQGGPARGQAAGHSQAAKAAPAKAQPKPQ